MNELIKKTAWSIRTGNMRDMDHAWEDIKAAYKKLELNFSQYLIFKRHLDNAGYFNLS